MNLRSKPPKLALETHVLTPPKTSALNPHSLTLNPHPTPKPHHHRPRQLTDDEKFLWRGLSVEEARRLARENARDIVAVGFDVSKTYIFADFDAVGGAFYRNVARVQRCVTMNQVRGSRGGVVWGRFGGGLGAGFRVYQVVCFRMRARTARARFGRRVSSAELRSNPPKNERCALGAPQP